MLIKSQIIKHYGKTTKPFLSNKGASKNQITLIEGDEIIQDDAEIAKIMNDFFSKATESLNIDMPSELLNIEAITTDDIIENILLKYSNHPSIKLINENVKKGCFSFNIVNVSVIEKEVNALDGKKASMSDGIPPKILKENSCVCCEPLTKIINDGILNSVFDSNLKKADLTPVHKADDTTDKKNYRNISLLDIVSKIFEKILQGQISDYMEEFLSPYLCGYRKGFNPQHALLAM